MITLTAADFERAITWNLVIAAEMIGKDTPYRDEGKERKWGSLQVCRQSGAWYDFAASVGDIRSIELVQHLKRRAGEEWSLDDSTRWVVKFLAEHPGIGQLEAEDDEWTETRLEATAALGRRYLDIAEPLPSDGTEVAYLGGRGLSGPYPEALRRVPNARPGESALLMPLTDNGAIRAILMTGIDALSTKSTVKPRQRFNIEPAHPGAVMEIAAGDPGVLDIGADTVVTEGLENGLSLLLARKAAGSHWRLVALPGIATLGHLPVRKGERIVFFQDSDPKDSPAQLGLQRGVDALLRAGAVVRVTKWSNIGDANAILQAEGGGVDELKRLIACAGSAALSLEGKVNELAKLSDLAYVQRRRDEAKGHGIPVADLDRLVRGRRPKPVKVDEASMEPSIILPVDPPWIGPIPQLGQLLDRMVVAIRRHVVLKEWQAHLVATWAALTYFVFNQRVNLQVMPRLAIQSATINSGKTALLRIVCTLVRHGKLYGRATSAGIYRALSQVELTLCLDEVEYLRSDPYAPMMQVLDSSHHREDATILLTEPQKFGPPIARELSTWAAMALACNGELPGSLQSRSLVVVLSRAMPDDKHELLETRLTPELVGLRRELGAWAATISALPMPSRSEMPAEIYNRDADNWRGIFAIAKLAGDEWLAQIREASLQSLQTETLPSLTTRLVSSINLAFGDNPKPDTWLDTSELIARLVAQEGEQWSTSNRGRAIDAYWLRTQLRGLLHPPGAQEWKETLDDGRRRHHRGYFYNQFDDAFRRYEQDKLGTFKPWEIHAAGDLESSGPSGTSGTTPKESKETADFSGPDGVPDDFGDPGQKKAKETAADETSVPDGPDDPLQLEGSSVCVPDADEWGWLGEAERAVAEGASMAESSKAAENLDPAPPEKARPTTRPKRATVRPKRAKANGSDPEQVAEPAASPMLDLSEPSLLDYIAGSIANEIRQLRAAHPQRSVDWIAKQSGQPRSLVREILGNGEGSE